MADINFETVFNTLKAGVVSLAQTTIKDYVNEAKADGLALLDQLKGDLATWTQLLASGQLSQADFTDLVEGEANLLEMNALEQAGIAEIDLDNFKTSLLSLIETTILSLL
jgi:hypothetical protein